MRTKAVIFTCSQHLEAAEIAAEAASHYFDVVFAIDENDSSAVSNRPIIWTSFKRNGNLNGIDACRGVANTLLSVMDSGYAIKVDSDTVIKDATPLVGYDVAGFANSQHPPTLRGCCYAVSRRAIEHAIACIDRAESIGIINFPEDVIITGYAQTLNKDDFKVNVIPANRLGVWHPQLAPQMKSRIANFGTYRHGANWCHQLSIDTMRHYLNS